MIVYSRTRVRTGNARRSFTRFARFRNRLKKEGILMNGNWGNAGQCSPKQYAASLLLHSADSDEMESLSLAGLILYIKQETQFVVCSVHRFRVWTWGACRWAKAAILPRKTYSVDCVKVTWHDDSISCFICSSPRSSARRRPAGFVSTPLRYPTIGWCCVTCWILSWARM